MDENFIKNAANLYYKENVEGEPLDQDTPIECFVAGAEFILRAKKIHQNKCNISDYSSYNLKKSNMDDTAKLTKILKNIEKIDKVTGFYITAPGDPSVGINPATWTLENDFYFDTPEELEEFRKELKGLFEFYCGEVTSVVTFEENQAMCDLEEQSYYEQFPVRYLIRDKDSGLDSYKQAGSTATYSSSVGDAIHSELPHWIPEEGSSDSEVIKSTDPRFKQILLREAQRLENEINNEEYRLKNARRNLRLIQQELKLGQK
jgi:hypothetical protein